MQKGQRLGNLENQFPPISFVRSEPVDVFQHVPVAHVLCDENRLEANLRGTEKWQNVVSHRTESFGSFQLLAIEAAE